MKTFVTAGVSKLNGNFALRATNREGNTYATILQKEGHTDVHLVALKEAMTKEDIRKYLPKLKAFQTPEILELLKGGGNEATSKAKKAVAKPTQAKAPAKKKKKAAANKSKKTEEAPADSDGSEVATAETSHDEHVDVEAELGQPVFARHVQAE
jgi:hypothetical protein